MNLLPFNRIYFMDFMGNEIFKDEPVSTPEMHEWCDENFGKGNWSFSIGMLFKFKDEIDAMAFKLRWS